MRFHRRFKALVCVRQHKGASRSLRPPRVRSSSGDQLRTRNVSKDGRQLQGPALPAPTAPGHPTYLGR